MDSARQSTSVTLSRPEQQKALVSPVRQEMLGHFCTREALSIAELARLMGRPATALYYHVGLLERSGILQRVGERPSGKRMETLFAAAAGKFEMPGLEATDTEDTVRAVRTAARMGVRDFGAGLRSPTARDEGPTRTLLAFRMQGRVREDQLERVNALIDELLAVVAEAAADCSDETGEFVSLTTILAPLKGRRNGENE